MQIWNKRCILLKRKPIVKITFKLNEKAITLRMHFWNSKIILFLEFCTFVVSVKNVKLHLSFTLYIYPSIYQFHIYLYTYETSIMYINLSIYIFHKKNIRFVYRICKVYLLYSNVQDYYRFAKFTFSFTFFVEFS